MRPAEARVFESVQEEVRERLNPGWKEQLEMHKGILAEMGDPRHPVAALIRFRREGHQQARRRKG
jgi:hypothetical protein